MQNIYNTIYEKAVFIDTGAVIALLNPSDSYHLNAHICVKELRKVKYPLYLSNVTIFESHKRLLYDFGYMKALTFIKCVYKSKVNILRPNEDDEKEAVRILKKYSDQHFSFHDALNFAIMKRYGILKAFSFDSHFSIYGFEKIPPFYS